MPRTILLILFFLPVFMWGCLHPAPFSENDSLFTLQILHSSDSESAFQDPHTLEPRILHYSAVVNGLRSLARKEGIPSIHLTAGDHTLPGPFYDAAAQVESLGFPGLADIAFFNAMQLSANGMGNHEFDGGINDFARMLNAADYPFIAANLDFSNVRLKEGVPPIRLGKDGGSVTENAGCVVKSAYAEAGGERIGIIGRAPADFFNVIKAPEKNLPGLDFVGGREPANNSPRISAISQVMDQVRLLSSKGINKIILLDHAQDYSADPLSASTLQGIDIIVTAGATGFLAGRHTAGPFNRLREGDAPQGDYPARLYDAEGHPVLVVNTDQVYRYAGHLMATFDADGHIVSVDPRSGPVAATARAADALAAEIGETVLPDARVKKLFEALSQTPSIRTQFEIITDTAFPLNGLRADVRSRETNLGRLAAEAALRNARRRYPGRNVVLSLKNGGGIRASIPGPHVTRLGLASAFPFDNKMAIVTLDGEELLAVMENAVSRFPHKDGRFPQIAGMELVFDPARPGLSGRKRLSVPSRVKSLRVIGKNGAGTPLVVNFRITENLRNTFSVVTNDFLLTGGDGYQALKAAAERNGRQLLYWREQETVAAYVRELPGGTINLADPPVPAGIRMAE